MVSITKAERSWFAIGCVEADSWLIWVQPGVHEKSILALLSYALLLSRAIVLRNFGQRAFVTARFCRRSFVGADLSCALLSGHQFDFMMHTLPKSLVELNVIFQLEGGFCEKLMNFTRLKKLEVQQPMHEIPITITNDIFECLRNISIDTLRIKSVYPISGIEPFVFYYFSELKSLDISGISAISIADFYPALIGLRNTKIEKLRLSSMQSYNIYSSSVFLNDTFCENLALPYLVDLQMDHAQLFALSDICFSSLPNLKVLNLSFNSLSMGYLYQFFNHLMLLRKSNRIRYQ